MGTWGAVFLSLNGMIGAAIFGLPGKLDAAVGPFAPWLLLIAGGGVMLIALCYADLATRFEATGGSQLYAGAAFGPFVGFQAGWLIYASRAAALGANATVLAAYAGALWPPLDGPITIIVTIAAITVINIVGLRRAIDVLGGLTMLKLIPLLLLVPVYIVWQMRDANVSDAESTLPAVGISTDSAAASRAAFILIGMFGLIRFLQVGGVASMQTFFNVYMDRELHVSTATIGTIQAIAKLLGVPAALAIPWLTRKVGAAGAVIGALVVAALGILPLAWIPIWWVGAAGYILVWLTTPVRYTAYMVYIMSHTPSRLHGTLNGSQEGLAGLSFALIAFAGGYMIQALGYSLLFTLSAVVMLLGALLMAWFAIVLRKRA